MYDLVDDLSRFAFFKVIFGFLDDELIVFRENLMGEFFTWVSAIAVILFTIWIIIQGYMIMTGRSRESLMSFVVNSMRVTLILTVASTMSFGTIPLYSFFTNSLPKEINGIVTGEEVSPADDIDDNLAAMEGTFIALNAIYSINNASLQEDRNRVRFLAAVGVAGPSVVAGCMMLLYKIALALFIGFGPFFVVSLLFEQTKQLFSRWLFYGIGTMFSFSVLCFMVSVAMKVVAAAAAAYVVEYGAALLDVGASAEGVGAMALQQGGIGLILTTLIITAPPMAAMFFQGTLGSFSAYNQIGAVSGPVARGPNGEPPGASASQKASVDGGHGHNQFSHRSHAPVSVDSASTGQKGLAR